MSDSLPTHSKRRWSARVLWEPRDLWIGVYWDRNLVLTGGYRTDVYVCILPCVPIKVSIRRV